MFDVADIGPNGGERGRVFWHNLDEGETALMQNGLLCIVYYLQFQYETFTGELVEVPGDWWIARNRELYDGTLTVFDKKHHGRK